MGKVHTVTSGSAVPSQPERRRHRRIRATVTETRQTAQSGRQSPNRQSGKSEKQRANDGQRLHVVSGGTKAPNRTSGGTATTQHETSRKKTPDATSVSVSSQGQPKRHVGFTEEERRLYDAAHAPFMDRVRNGLADAVVPLVCVIVIGVAILLNVLMSFSSVILTTLAIGAGVVLMGSIVYLTYEDQRRAEAMADEAEMILLTKGRIAEGDAAAGSTDGKAAKS